MTGAYVADRLPLAPGVIDPLFFLEELIDATAKLEVYREKIRDSKLDSAWFMPTLQQKEALASSALEGTQATLDGVLSNQVTPTNSDQNLIEVQNYYQATAQGYEFLKSRSFSHDFFFEIHRILMSGNVRKSDLSGAYRTTQNYIGRKKPAPLITFVPPVPDEVEPLMENLIAYINGPQDNFRPLVRTAIIHAQFETIHPFGDGNGRVGRILIPMYLYYKQQIDLPCFFISEALEQDKLRYYTLLNNIRYKNEWNEWIKFFLSTVAKQCEKYINIISRINMLYEQHLAMARDLARSANIVDLMNALYQYPIATAKHLAEVTNIPQTSINRYLNLLVENQILYTDNRSRNRTFFYLELLDILRA